MSALRLTADWSTSSAGVWWNYTVAAGNRKCGIQLVNKLQLKGYSLVNFSILCQRGKLRALIETGLIAPLAGFMDKY